MRTEIDGPAGPEQHGADADDGLSFGLKRWWAQFLGPVVWRSGSDRRFGVGGWTGSHCDPHRGYCGSPVWPDLYFGGGGNPRCGDGAGARARGGNAGGDCSSPGGVSFSL